PARASGSGARLERGGAGAASLDRRRGRAPAGPDPRLRGGRSRADARPAKDAAMILARRHRRPSKIFPLRHTVRLLACAAAAAAGAGLLACAARSASLADPGRADPAAPPVFRVRFETTRGTFDV